MVLSQVVLVYVCDGLGLERRKEGERKRVAWGWEAGGFKSLRQDVAYPGQNVRCCAAPPSVPPSFVLSSSFHRCRGPQFAAMSHTQRALFQFAAPTPRVNLFPPFLLLTKLWF